MIDDKQKEQALSPGLYTELEIQSGVKELFGYETFVQGMQRFLPAEISDLILQASKTVSNSFEFQRDIVHPLLQYLKKSGLTELRSSGLEGLDPAKKYLFISNHRDIGLDSAFLNVLLFDNGFTTTQIAIGDNLVKHRVAELIFRINKSFIVRRSGPPRELYKSSVALSAYIKEQVSTGKDSVWLAQREGRAKDGNDQTQVSVLKMLAMCAGKNNLQQHFTDLNIVPVAISYEYNPSDYYMTKEYVDRLENPDYKKTFADDMASILQGLKGHKGNVQVSFGRPIQFDAGTTLKDNKAVLQTLAKKIDEQIHQNYALSPINYYAFDQVENSTANEKYYPGEIKAKLDSYFSERISQFPSKNQELAKDYLLGMYAYPVKNSTRI